MEYLSFNNWCFRSTSSSSTCAGSSGMSTYSSWSCCELSSELLLASEDSFCISFSSSLSSSLPLEGGMPSSAVSWSEASSSSQTFSLFVFSFSDCFPVFSRSDWSILVWEPSLSTSSFLTEVSFVSASMFPAPLKDSGCTSSLSALDGGLCWACSRGAAWSGFGLERSSGEGSGLNCRPPSTGLSTAALSHCPRSIVSKNYIREISVCIYIECF